MSCHAHANATPVHLVAGSLLLMAFFVGAILFAALVGALDAKLPWPKP
jgi:hypothetical protein